MKIDALGKYVATALITLSTDCAHTAAVPREMQASADERSREIEHKKGEAGRKELWELLYIGTPERCMGDQARIKKAYESGNVQEYLAVSTIWTVNFILELDRLRTQMPLMDTNFDYQARAVREIDGLSRLLADPRQVKTQLGLPEGEVRNEGLFTQQDRCHGYVVVVDTAEAMFQVPFARIMEVSPTFTEVNAAYSYCGSGVHAGGK